MPKVPSCAAVAAFALLGIRVSWIHYSSTLFPYTIAQPSSYRHLVLVDPLGRKGEFFFPDLGSFTTNVNVYAEPGSTVQDQSDLQSMGATRVFKSQWIHIDGKGMPLMRGDFKGIPGRWIMEQATFVDQGKVWHLTVSYDVKYGSMRPMMVRMLKSFHAHP